MVGETEDRLAIIARNRAAASPVVQDLRRAGFEVEGIADFYNQKLEYRTAIPILIKWLPKIDNLDVKQDIVRALAVRWASPDAAEVLIDEFERVEDANNLGIRWAIGSALEVVAGSQHISELSRLAKERRFGRAREMIVLALGNTHDERAIPVLIELLNDSEVAGHAVMALGRLNATSARSHIERFIDHPNAWIRREAQKALATTKSIRMKKESTPNGGKLNFEPLAEASMNFDIDSVGPFLRRVAGMLQGGFRENDLRDLSERAVELDVDQEFQRRFEVSYESTPMPLTVQVAKDDVDVVNMYFFAPRPLADRIAKEMMQFAEDLGI